MQAVRWIKAREGKALEGKVKTFNDADFLKQLELAVTYGAAFLFEGCDEYIDPVIDPVLEKALTPGPGGKMVSCLRIQIQHAAELSDAAFGCVLQSLLNPAACRAACVSKPCALALNYPLRTLSTFSTPQTLKLGDKEIDWDPAFRLYLTTKLANPHYGPEVAGKTSIINYAVTQVGRCACFLLHLRALLSCPAAALRSSCGCRFSHL